MSRLAKLLHCLLFALLLLPVVVMGQMTVLSTSASSGISFRSAGGEEVRVFAGQNLPNEGTLLVQRGRSLQLVSGSHKLEVVGPKEVNLVSLTDEINAQPQSTFLGRFFNFLSSSVTNTGNAKDVENYHRKYMTNTRAGIKGFGSSDAEIWMPEYFTGPITSEVLHLSWEAAGPEASYLVVVRGWENEDTILSATTAANQLRLPLADLALAPAEVYELSVTTLGGTPQAATSEKYFSYEPTSARDLLDELHDRPMVKTMGELERQLYYAHKMEEKGLLQSAYSHYEAMLAADADNALVRKVFAAFLVRMNDPEAARKTLEK